MTEKQKRLVELRISQYGIETVNEYLHRHYPCAKIEKLKKIEAQKIISGMPVRNTHAISGVFLRDFLDKI